MKPFSLSNQHCTAVDIKDLAGDESGVLRTQEQDWSCDFLRSADPAERDCAKHPFATVGIAQRSSRHVRGHPTRRDAIDPNAERRQLRRKSFGHADERTLGCGVVAVSSLTALTSCRTDQYDASAPALPFHLRDGMLDQCESAVEVNRDRRTPLPVLH